MGNLTKINNYGLLISITNKASQIDKNGFFSFTLNGSRNEAQCDMYVV